MISINRLFQAIGIGLIATNLLVVNAYGQQVPNSDGRTMSTDTDLLESMPNASDASANLSGLIDSLNPMQQLSGNSANDMAAPEQAGDEVWQLILNEYKSEQEVYLLELRIRNLLENERQRSERQRSEQQTNQAPMPNDPNSDPNGNSPASERDRRLFDPPLQTSTTPQNIEPTSPDQPRTTIASSKRILAESPDRLALADSLFVSGDAELALQMYQGLAIDDPEGWIRYQIANCFRRMDRWSDAKPLLRETVESGISKPWLANSRWWIDIGDRQLEVEGELILLQKFIDSKKADNVPK